jgi:hypothetical protein
MKKNYRECFVFLAEVGGSIDLKETPRDVLMTVVTDRHEEQIVATKEFIRDADLDAFEYMLVKVCRKLKKQMEST